MPEKLHRLQSRWLIEAVKCNVVPIDDRTPQRFDPEIRGRPELIRRNTSQVGPTSDPADEPALVSDPRLARQLRWVERKHEHRYSLAIVGASCTL